MSVRPRLAFLPMLLAGLAAPCPSCAQAASAPPPPPACSASEYRQFDFWLGDWDVSLADGKPAGRNVIKRIAGGCALHENWAGRSGFTGQSLNGWNREKRQWQQTWLDSSGGRLDLAGGLRDGAMVLEGRTTHAQKPGVMLQHRITWTAGSDGQSVRQLWQTSEDDGRSWATTFDGRYLRRP